MDNREYCRVSLVVTISVFSFVLLPSNLDIYAEEHEEQDDIELEGNVNYVVDGDTRYK